MMIRRASRRRGMAALQAVLLLGAAFVVVWGLMALWDGTKPPLQAHVHRILGVEARANTPPGTVAGGGHAGGGANTGRPGRVPTPTPTPVPVPGPTPTPTPTPVPTPTPAPTGLTTLPSGTPQSLSQMDVNTLGRMSDADRLAWYRAQLDPYAAALKRSAAANGIPEQLLATVLLNELADISWQDTWQQNYPWSNGSLGIAQIQVDTAIAHGLVTYPGDNTAAGNWRATVRERLKTPEIAIEAAAREIAHILTGMTANRTNPWQQRFGFSLATLPARGTDLYAAVNGADQRERELNLSEMVVAAYNSPGIVLARNPASVTPGAVGFIYNNGTIHGRNSRDIAGELFDALLYR